MASVMRRIRRGRFWIKPHLETAKREQYEHTKVTIDSGRARKPDLHSCTAGAFNTTYTTHTRSGAAEAGCVADSTGTPSCQQWHCFDDDAGQCFNQPAEATAAKAAWKCEAGQVSREVTALGRLPAQSALCRQAFGSGGKKFLRGIPHPHLLGFCCPNLL